MYFIWDKKTRLVRGESCVFAGAERTRLLFPAEKIVKVENKVTGQVFEEGKDFSHVPGSDLLERLPGSRLRFLTEKDLYPDPADAILFNAPGANAIEGGPDGKLLLFDNCNAWAERQFEVDYIASCELGFPFPLYKEEKRLPRFRRKLAAGEPLRIALMGDSISEGQNASGFHGFPPHQGAYFSLFCEEVAKKAPLDACNASVGGYGINQTFQRESLWRKPDTDLFIIAFGMNDIKRHTPEVFLEKMQEVIAAMKETAPACEYLLVISMPGNPQWIRTPYEMSEKYGSAIRAFRDGSPADLEALDVFTPWSYAMERKGFLSMTGNGVNHPNDFGHRFYASLLLGLFEDEIQHS